MPGTPARRNPKLIAKVMRLAKQGRSCREIAKAVGYSRTTVSQIAKDKGHTWGAVNTKRATEARLAYSAEKRAAQVLTLCEKFDAMADRLTGPYVMQAFSIKDGEFHATELECPDGKAANDLASACYRIVSTMKLLHNFEANGDEQHGAVDEYLRQQDVAPTE